MCWKAEYNYPPVFSCILRDRILSFEIHSNLATKIAHQKRIYIIEI